MTAKKAFVVSKQYINSHWKRQNYLDALNANPGMTAAELARHMARYHGDHSKASHNLTVLENLGEIRHEGPLGKYRYYALTTVTIAPEEMQRLRQIKAAESMKGVIRSNQDKLAAQKAAEKKRRSEPWRYVHTPGEVTFSAGGQGALRDRVWPGTAGKLNW